MEFVSFAPDYWDGPRHNRHYFCLELARHHKVLFVSPPISIEKLLTRPGIRALARSGTRKLSENLWTYAPSVLLFTNHRFPRLDRVFRAIRHWRLKRRMRAMGITRPVLLVWHPQYLGMLDAFPDCPSVYYIYDNLSGYAGNETGRRWTEELELIRRCDMVLALSRKLLEENERFNANIFLLPNAVDFEHFSKARLADTPVPDEIAAIPGPRIGYVGSINEKVDVDLLEAIAERKPDWSIVLVGRQNFSIEENALRFARLIERRNVYWIPYRSPDVLPGYLKGLDVCLMCYVINGWTYFGDPSKLHEYLAAGKPTIGTALPSILEFRDVIDVPAGHDDWIAAIERNLQLQSPQDAERRVRVARANSYAERIRTVIDLLERNGKRRDPGVTST